jgi:hypothetical protein
MEGVVKKALFIAAAAIVLAFVGVTNAADYVQMEEASSCLGEMYVDIPFYLQHDSDDPPVLTAGTHGFVLTGGIELLNIVPDPDFPGDITFWIHDNDGFDPDTIVVEFTSSEGIPSYQYRRSFFTLMAHYHDAEEICVDSTWVSPAYEWSWSGPGSSTTPGFVNNNLENSPLCFELWEGVCGVPSILTVPLDDQLIGYSGCELTFEYQTNKMLEGLEGPGWVDFSIPFGPGSVVSSSCSSAVYTCPPLPAATYSAVLEANYCCQLDYYEFDVVFLEEEPPLGDCDCSGDVDIDDVVYLIAYIFSGGPEPQANPDCQGEVDIDDVVYLINHIFSSGPAPCG